MENILNELKIKFKGTGPEQKRKDLVFIEIEPALAVAALTWLRDVAGYRHLVLISAVDWIEESEFQLTYILRSYREKNDICLKVLINRDRPVMESIDHLWAGAQVFQRELKEMFGIDFPGSPRVDEPMILEGWDEIPPMRRDFDTKEYSERTYYPREGRSTSTAVEVGEKHSYPVDARMKEEVRRLIRGEE